MKTKFLKPLQVISFLLVLTTFSCNESNPNQENFSDLSKVNSITFPKLKIKAINEMIAEYRKNQFSILNSDPNISNESSWINLKKLESFISYVKAIAKDNNLNDKKIGIRFYFANLSGNYNDKITCNRKSNDQTLILVPTVRIDNIDYDLNLHLTNTDEEIISLIVDSCDENVFINDYKMVKSLIDNYRNFDLKRINLELRDINQGDTQSIWFDLNGIENFCNAIKINSKHSNLYSDEELGIELVNAAYPKASIYNITSKYFSSNELTKVPADYEFRHTLIMLPTMRKSNHLPSVLLNEKYIFDLTKNEIQALSKNSNSDEEILAKNHGSLIPPITHTGESF